MQAIKTSHSMSGSSFMYKDITNDSGFCGHFRNVRQIRYMPSGVPKQGIGYREAMCENPFFDNI